MAGLSRRLTSGGKAETDISYHFRNSFGLVRNSRLTTPSFTIAAFPISVFLTSKERFLYDPLAVN